MLSLSCDLWLLDPYALRQFVNLVGSLGDLTPELRAAMGTGQVSPRQQNTVAIIPVHGVLETRPTFMGQFFGLSSYEGIGNALDQVMNDSSVKGVIFDHASPGGMAYGAPELADKIFNYRGTKPMVSIANPMAASGSYWIAAAADRVVLTPSGDVGSVGVVSKHVDFSQADEKNGVKITTIRSTGSPYKAEASDGEPLTEEAQANLQQRADEVYAQFAGDLARFRGTTVEKVNEHFGKGRLVSAKSAIAAGMADRAMTLAEVVHKMAAGRIRIAGNRAQDDWDHAATRNRIRERAAQIREAAIESAESGELRAESQN